jgi:site-specific DNA-methyltransferase (adenine-specific)
MELKTNVLYYGDNLDILRRREYFPDESIDLIYLDPPFNSNRSYNVLFRESTGAASEAQIEAFEDTWHWGPAAAHAYEEAQSGPHQKVARMLRAMVDGLGHNDVTAYLTMMAVRLVELHRVLKPTGSIYLHCDPTASHYLKMLMDAVFGPSHFRNEIVWQRTSAHGDSKKFGRVNDTILYCCKSDRCTWNPQYAEHDPGYVEAFYRYNDPERGPFRLDHIIRSSTMGPRPNLVYEYKGYTPKWGWRVTRDKLEALDRDGRLHLSKTGRPYLKRFLNEMKGTALKALWTDIPPVGPQARERLGYPTQKPLTLLERIINVSSNPGDIVLDPFCGCGTAVHAAHKLGRRWIGIDITHLAIGLVRRRMQDAFPGLEIEVIGEPVDLAGARDLAQRDKYQFQWWALDRLGAQPVSGRKRGADLGIDGVIPFFAGPKEDYRRALVSVKGGEHVSVGMVRDLVGVLEREKEPIGLLLTLEPPTQPMVTEAAAAGFYHNDFWQKDYPRLQILTVEEMLAGKRPQVPQTRSPFAQAPLEREERHTKRML